MEGDSQILILGLGKILNGVNADKISNNWRLLSGLGLVAELVNQIPMIILSHIKWKGNALAYLLGNEGVS